MDYFRPQSASSAVKIVDPSTQNDRYPKSGPKANRSCKFQDKGCTFYHPPSDPDASRAEEALSASVNINAPVFVPKSSADTSSPTLASLTPSSPPPDVSHAYSENGTAEVADQMQGTHIYDDNYAAQFDQGYYAAQPVYTRAPLDYHLYSGPLPSAFSPASADIHFMPSSASIRETLQTRSELIRSVNPSAVQLPEELQGYHSLSPLETVTVTTERRKFGNWYSTVYKAINSSDGGAYALRRIESYRMTQQSAFAPIEAWSKIRHPNIVSVCEAFTTRAFNDNSLVVAYTYHPNAQTLFDVHLKPKGTHTSHHQHQHWYAPGRGTARGPNRNTQSTGLSERTIWSYVVQIASAIRKVHEAGQAVRTIEPSKILVTGRNRIRIGSCGLVDVLMHEMNQDMAVLQQEDFIRFGGLILVLCCNNAAASAPMNLQKSFDLVERAYGADLKNLIAFLLGKASAQKLRQLFDLLSSRIATEMDDALDAVDRLEGELMSELENARLVRLMAKFGFINERPEFARDARWSETGDRYIIKLFRDYVFHQVDEYGNPVVSLSHVLTTLNKLDAGTDEKIMLVARDEQSCLVVSYKEIKTCLESAFSELAGSQQTKAKEVYRGGG
ncbi:PAB-dependent poly(A)-specific ribonuclease subunit 3 [Pleurotus pulmonarius]|nr:PAB-dependent poly(A)-specific ribonuclease subunit 3 [Pleurotus pulmonarius]KAF4588862.1 PAB-dependent poly(A)-specific ribonuclease subunit 3 [Pleurotus pulmonarius]